MAATYLCNSGVRGYPVHQSMWSAKENLVCKRKISNLRDSYAVVVVKTNRLANLCSLFIC